MSKKENSNNPSSNRKKEYKKYLKSKDWKDKKKEKKNRNVRCAFCSSTENIDIHHLNYKNWYDVAQSDLRRLCRRCHFLVHDLEKEGKIVYKSDNHHSKYAIQKVAVKKFLGLTGKNMFNNDQEE